MSQKIQVDKEGLPAGTIIANKYRIEDGPVVGCGAWSVVKGCVSMPSYDPPGSTPGMQFVVKILEKKYLISLTEGDVERAMVEVKLEIETLRHIPAHKNVVTFIESIETESHFFLVFEKVSCGDLCELILQDPAGKLSEERSKKYILQLINAVLHCHVHDVIHRDIKPENLLVNDDDVLKLTDFGLAKRVRSFNSSYHGGGFGHGEGKRDSGSVVAGYDNLMDSYNPSSNDPLGVHALLVPYVGCERLIGKRVECSDVIGTPRYGAPEMFYAKFTKTHYDGFAADTWAIGVVAYIVLSGKFPYSAASGSAASDEEMFHTITDYALVLPTDITPIAEDFIQCLLQKDPNKRMPLYATLYHPWLAQVAPPRGSVVARLLRSSPAMGAVGKSSEMREICDRFDMEAQQLHRCIAHLQYELHKAREGQVSSSYGVSHREKDEEAECGYGDGSFVDPVRTSKSSPSSSKQQQQQHEQKHQVQRQQLQSKSSTSTHPTPGRSSRRTLTPGRASSNIAALSPPHRSRSVMGSSPSHPAPPHSSVSSSSAHKSYYHHQRNGLSSSSRSGSSSAMTAAGRDGSHGPRLSTVRSPASRLRVTSPIRAGLYGVRVTTGSTNSTHRSSSRSSGSVAAIGGVGAMTPSSVVRGHASTAATARSRLYQSPMHREENNSHNSNNNTNHAYGTHSNLPGSRSRSSSTHTSRNNYLRHAMMTHNSSSSNSISNTVNNSTNVMKRTGVSAESSLTELTASDDAALLTRRRMALNLRTKSPLTRSAGGAAVRRGTPLRAGIMSNAMHTDSSPRAPPADAGSVKEGLSANNRWAAVEDVNRNTNSRSSENGTRSDLLHHRHASHFAESNGHLGGDAHSFYDAATMQNSHTASTSVHEVQRASLSSHNNRGNGGSSESSYPDYVNNSHSQNTVNKGNHGTRSRSNSVRHVASAGMSCGHDTAHGPILEKTILSPTRNNSDSINSCSNSEMNAKVNNSMNSGPTKHYRCSSVCSTRSTSAAAADTPGRGVTPTRGGATRRVRVTAEAASVLGDGAVRGDRGSSLMSSRLNGSGAAGSSVVYQGRVGNDLHINDAVIYKGYRAIVRFNGPVTFGAGVWVGLEMLEGNEGTNNGYSFIDKKQYFTCPKNRGVFVRASQVRKL